MMSRFIQKFILIACLSLSTASAFSKVPDYQIEQQDLVVATALQLPCKGVLKQKPNGYLYLEVSKEFISETLPLIEAQGRIVPPRHYTSKKGIGAHISVMYENEQIMNEIWEIQEVGQEYTFEVLELRTVKISRDNKVKKLWLLALSCPELEALRIKYGLPSKIKGHDFHITIGSQLPGTARCIEEEEIQEAA